MKRGKENEMQRERAETISGVAAVAAGTGTLLLALFPLSLPFLVLTAVAVAPLALLGLVPLLAVGLAAGVVVAIRAGVRGITGRGRKPELLVPRAER